MGVYVQREGKWVAVDLPTIAPPPPRWIDLLVRFKAATRQWAKAGFAVVPAKVFRARLRACRGCRWWKGWGCRYCGCAGVKLWLATEECPLPAAERRWKASFTGRARGLKRGVRPSLRRVLLLAWWVVAWGAILMQPGVDRYYILVVPVAVGGLAAGVFYRW